MVRSLARGNHDRAQRMLRWPLREILRGYRVIARQQAFASWRIRHLEYVIEQMNSDKRVRPPVKPLILEN